MRETSALNTFLALSKETGTSLTFTDTAFLAPLGAATIFVPRARLEFTLLLLLFTSSPALDLFPSQQMVDSLGSPIKPSA